jgi:hypothetical protein
MVLISLLALEGVISFFILLNSSYTARGANNPGELFMIQPEVKAVTAVIHYQIPRTSIKVG